MGINIQPKVTDRTSRILGCEGSETKDGISVNRKASILGSVIEKIFATCRQVGKILFLLGIMNHPHPVSFVLIFSCTFIGL